jgi:hypothetical protein
MTNPAKTANPSGQTRAFHAEVHYEEWWQQRRFLPRKRCVSWWATLDVDGCHCNVIAGSATELREMIFEHVRWVLEDDACPLLITGLESTRIDGDWSAISV